MYIICTYDVEEKKCEKVMKLMRKYLFHVQYSVFEGEITPSKFIELKDQLYRIVDEEEDSILFYMCYENKSIQKDYIGSPGMDMTVIL